jgi:hypothetical protein
MKLWHSIALMMLILLVVTTGSYAADNGLAVGYGFGFLNSGMRGIQIRDGNYDYLQIRYIREAPLFSHLNWVIEPYISYINRPKEGVDGGFSLLMKAYLDKEGKHGFYGVGGAGVQYTSMGYSGQGTHLLGSLECGFGYRWDKLFIEDRFVHYSNGGTAEPNRSLNSNVIYFGLYF